MIRLELLTGRHDRSGFDCGVEPLGAWLRQTALQHQSKGGSRTFVAVPHDENAVAAYQQAGYGGIAADSIIGFYSLASSYVLIHELPAEWIKRYPRQIPVTRLGRLAIRSDMQNQGLGRLLLADAINRAQSAAQAVGSAGIFVDAKNDDAARFFRQFGFHACGGQPLKLYLPLW